MTETGNFDLTASSMGAVDKNLSEVISSFFRGKLDLVDWKQKDPEWAKHKREQTRKLWFSVAEDLGYNPYETTNLKAVSRVGRHRKFWYGEMKGKEGSIQISKKHCRSLAEYLKTIGHELYHFFGARFDSDCDWRVGICYPVTDAEGRFFGTFSSLNEGVVEKESARKLYEFSKEGKIAAVKSHPGPECYHYEVLLVDQICRALCCSNSEFYPTPTEAFKLFENASFGISAEDRDKPNNQKYLKKWQLAIKRAFGGEGALKKLARKIDNLEKAPKNKKKEMWNELIEFISVPIVKSGVIERLSEEDLYLLGEGEKVIGFINKDELENKEIDTEKGKQEIKKRIYEKLKSDEGTPYSSAYWLWAVDPETGLPNIDKVAVVGVKKN